MRYLSKSTCVQTAEGFIFLLLLSSVVPVWLDKHVFVTFCDFLSCHQPCSINGVWKESNLLGWLREERNNGEDKMRKNSRRGRLFPVNLGPRSVFVIRWRMLAKSLHYGLFSHLAQSAPDFIRTPLRQSVNYSSPISCSQKKGRDWAPMPALIALWPATLLPVSTAYSRYDTTLEGVMSPGRRCQQESPGDLISDPN